MISPQASIFLQLSSFISINMRAVALLCLLHAACATVMFNYNWDGPVTIGQTVTEQTPNKECLKDQSACGCCLMKRQMDRMEWFFNHTYGELNKKLTQTKTILNEMRASRSAFSVTLNNGASLNCYGPFNSDKVLAYKHTFINLGNNYNLQNGIFTAPRNGVYSISVTIYAASTAHILRSCANLQVNSKVVYELQEKNGQDLEDSATVAMAVKLKAGDQVAVILPKGCAICDDNSHYNTFTGFLLYASG